MARLSIWLPLLYTVLSYTNAFSVVFMAPRRGRNNQKKSKDAIPNQGKGQEITGVTLPATNKLKGWAFGDNVNMVCANVDGAFYGIQGECPRCGFDLWRGDLINDEAFEDLPRVACPTCSTTYGLRSGKTGPPLKRTGLSGFVSGLAKSATEGASSAKDAQIYQITYEEGRVFCKERGTVTR